MTGDELAALDTIGVPGVLPSRGAGTSFVTTAGGRTIFNAQLFQPENPDIGNQPSGSGIGVPNDDGEAVLQAPFVLDGHELLGVGDVYEVILDNTQSMVPENHTPGGTVSRELFPADSGTPLRSMPPPPPLQVLPVLAGKEPETLGLLQPLIRLKPLVLRCFLLLVPWPMPPVQAWSTSER